MDKSVIAAFEERFIPEPNSGCWLWIGNRFSESRGGYGCFTMRPAGILNVRAHRMAFAIYCRAITSAEHVLHSCDNRACVNPDHLFIGDQPANMADKVRKGRQDHGEKHGRSKLTEAQAREIKTSAERGRDLAKRFNVTEATISEIKSGKSWLHLA